MSSTATAATRKLAPSGFGEILRAGRQRRRLSQLELSFCSGASQRHLSFLESGRARPSRAMVLQLCEALDVPLRERNAWLVAAGFAPVFSSYPLDDPQMSQVLAAVQRMLSSHEPFPALAVDRAWNVLLANRAFDRLVGLLGDDVWQRTGDGARNLLRLMFHPHGIRPWVSNWPAVGPVLWRRACREAEAAGGEGVAAILDELRDFQEPGTLRPVEEPELVPLMSLVLERDGVRVALFTVISTFGTAQDVTADETRIETFFPSDSATEALFVGLADA